MNKITALFLLILALLSGSIPTKAQQNTAKVFDAAEYDDVLQLNFKGMFGNTPSYHLLKGKYTRIMRSPEVGLFNRCEAYTRDDGTAVISLRGTVNKTQSWLENFFAAMVKANGSLQLNDSTIFDYKVASDSQACVHAGWLLGLAYLSPYINRTMDSLLAIGRRSFIIAGHSQGGALAFLTTSYLYYKYIVAYPDMEITTYCSAAPKPGNQYYANDFDFIMRNGHAYRVVNGADWVPETPYSIQTINDMNDPNPMKYAKPTIRKQKFLIRIAMGHVYNKLNNGSKTAMKRYRKYLGYMVHKQVKKTLPQLKQPNFVYSINYATAGAPVILKPDSLYRTKFEFDGKNVFVHHTLQAYEYLLKQYYPLAK